VRYDPDVQGRGWGAVFQTGDVGQGGGSKKLVFGRTPLMDDPLQKFAILNFACVRMMKLNHCKYFGTRTFVN